MYFTFLATMMIGVLSTHDKQPREDQEFLSSHGSKRANRTYCTTTALWSLTEWQNTYMSVLILLMLGKLRLQDWLRKILMSGNAYMTIDWLQHQGNY
jgi:hypothetical protein